MKNNLDYNEFTGIWERANKKTEKHTIMYYNNENKNKWYNTIIEERYIYKILCKFRYQRVSHMEFEKDGRWCVKEGISCDDERTKNAVLTCYLRGWVEKVPDTKNFEFITEGHCKGANYSLTNAGWDKIHNMYKWISITATITTVILILTVYTTFF